MASNLQDISNPPRTYFSVWQRLLRGYGPLAVLIVTLLLMSLLIPSKVQDSGTKVSSGLHQRRIDRGRGEHREHGRRRRRRRAGRRNNRRRCRRRGCHGRRAGLAVRRSPRSGPGRPVLAAVHRVRRRQRWRHVPGRDRHRDPRSASGCSTRRASSRRWPQLAGATLSDTPDDIKRTIDALAEYFNKRYQFYGRKIVMDFYNGVGLEHRRAARQGPRQGRGRRRHRAVDGRVRRHVGHLRALRRRPGPQGRHGLRRPVPVAEVARRAPRPTSGASPPTARSSPTSPPSTRVKQLCGKPRRRAGGDLKGKPRKFATFAPENSWYQESVRGRRETQTGRRLRPGREHRVPARPRHDVEPGGQPHPKMKSEGVTTIFCGCDPIMPVFLSGEGNSQGYYPEFIIVGTALTDTDIVGQLWNQNFASPRVRRELAARSRCPPQQTIAYEAYKTVRQRRARVHASTSSTTRWRMMAIGIQMAGPDTDAGHVRATGMFTLPAASSARPGPGASAPTTTPRPTTSARSTGTRTRSSNYNGKQGAYVETDHRALHGRDPVPGGDPNMPGPAVNRLLERWRSSRRRALPHGAGHRRAGRRPVSAAWHDRAAPGRRRPRRDAAVRHRRPRHHLGTVTALWRWGSSSIYRANRFINFAYGAMGSLVGVIGIGMCLEHGWSYCVMLPLGDRRRRLVGALIEFLVIRRFPNSPAWSSPSRASAWPSCSAASSCFITRHRVHVARRRVQRTARHQLPTRRRDACTGDEMLIIVIVPAVIAGLAWFLLKTDAGIAVRAAAENLDRALLLGIPVRRLATIVWIIAGGLAALTFMLKAPFAGVKPGVALERSDGPAAGPGRRGGRADGVAAARLRRRHRPRDHGAGRALEQRRQPSVV